MMLALRLILRWRKAVKWCEINKICQKVLKRPRRKKRERKAVKWCEIYSYLCNVSTTGHTSQLTTMLALRVWVRLRLGWRKVVKWCEIKSNLGVTLWNQKIGNLQEWCWYCHKVKTWYTSSQLEMMLALRLRLVWRKAVKLCEVNKICQKVLKRPTKWHTNQLVTMLALRLILRWGKAVKLREVTVNSWSHIKFQKLLIRYVLVIHDFKRSIVYNIHKQ